VRVRLRAYTRAGGCLCVRTPLAGGLLGGHR
jgi:hypothetical protein